MWLQVSPFYLFLPVSSFSALLHHFSSLRLSVLVQEGYIGNLSRAPPRHSPRPCNCIMFMLTRLESAGVRQVCTYGAYNWAYSQNFGWAPDFII